MLNYILSNFLPVKLSNYFNNTELNVYKKLVQCIKQDNVNSVVFKVLHA